MRGTADTGAAADDNRLFSVLLHAYLAERADDTPATASFLSLLAAILGFLTIIGFGLTHASSVPAWAIAVIPLPTIPFIAFGTIVAHAAQVRGLVIDDYERRLRALAPDIRLDQIAVPYGHSLLNRSLWQSWFAKTAIGLAFLALFPLYVGVLIVACAKSHSHAPVIAVASLTYSASALIVLLILFFIALRPARAWQRGVAELRAAESRGPRRPEPVPTRVGFDRREGSANLENEVESISLPVESRDPPACEED